MDKTGQVDVYGTPIMPGDLIAYANGTDLKFSIVVKHTNCGMTVQNFYTSVGLSLSNIKRFSTDLIRLDVNKLSSIYKMFYNNTLTFLKKEGKL